MFILHVLNILISGLVLYSVTFITLVALPLPTRVLSNKETGLFEKFCVIALYTYLLYICWIVGMWFHYATRPLINLY